jgi:hypothetical protein
MPEAGYAYATFSGFDNGEGSWGAIVIIIVNRPVNKPRSFLG